MQKCHLENKDFEHVAKMADLDTLLVSKCKFLTDECLTVIEKLKNLTTFEFGFSGYNEPKQPLNHVILANSNPIHVLLIYLQVVLHLSGYINKFICASVYV